MSSVSILLDREYGCQHGKRMAKRKEPLCGRVDNFLELAEDKAATYRLEEMQCHLPSSVRSTFLITFSHDGLKVASACGDHNVWVCDVRTGKLLKTLKGHPRTPWCLAFHPTSNDILASGCLGGEVRVWDLHGSSEVWVVEQKQPITSLAFHPTDKVLVIATLNQLHFWDWSLPAPFATCETNSDKEKVRYVKFDAQGTRLITGITNVPPESQRSNIAESLYGQPYFHPRSTSARSFSAQRNSILNRLMNLYSHLEGLEEISRYTGSGANSSSNRSGALSPTQDDALQRARLFAEEVSIHNAHLYRQRLYNLDQALGLQSEPPSGADNNTSRASTSRSGEGSNIFPPWHLNSESSTRNAERTTASPSFDSRLLPEIDRNTSTTGSVAPQLPNYTYSSQASGAPSAATSSGRSSISGYGSVNADFWVTFHRLRFICSSLERRIHQQPPPSLLLDMPNLPSIPTEQFASTLLPNFPVPESSNLRPIVPDPPTLRSMGQDSLLRASSSTAHATSTTTTTASTSDNSSTCPPQNPGGSGARETPSSPDVSVSLVSLLTRLQHSLQSLSNAALTTAVARDQIQQVRTRIAEILERLDNVSGYRARLTNLRDQIYEAADRMAQRGEDNTQGRDLAYCLWLVEMSLQLTRDMQRILATDYRLTQLHLNTSMPSSTTSATSNSNTATTANNSNSTTTARDTSSTISAEPDLLQQSNRRENTRNTGLFGSNTTRTGTENNAANSEPSTSTSSSQSYRARNYTLGSTNSETGSGEGSPVRSSISERINNLFYRHSAASSTRTRTDAACTNLPFSLRSSLSNSSDSYRSFLSQETSERLPTPFSNPSSGNNPDGDSGALSDPLINFDSSPFFWLRNQGLRNRLSSSDLSEPNVRVPTVPTLSSTVGILLDLGLEHSISEYGNSYQPSTSRSSPFAPPNRRLNLNVYPEHPPMNDASTSTSVRIPSQEPGIPHTPASRASSPSHSRSSSSDRPQSSLGRGTPSRIITSAIRPTRSAIARRRFVNYYRINMSPASIRRRRLYRWSSQQPLTATGGTQLVVNPRQNRQNYSDTGTSEGSHPHDNSSTRSVNRGSATTESSNFYGIGARISRRIRSPYPAQNAGAESEIILNRLRTVQRERNERSFTIPQVQIDPTNSPSDPDLPPLPPEQRPRSPPLSTILSRAGVNLLGSGSASGTGGTPTLNNYLGVASPRLGPVPSYWSHFYDTGFRPRGMGGGIDSPHNLTYRIQCWDFSSYIIPNISQSESSIVVPKCKINNDGSIDISKDGRFLVAFVPNIGNMRQSTMAAVYSLASQTMGQCLYTWNFENTNAVSVSFSPLSRYLVIGIGSTHRHHLGATEREPVAQIFRLDPCTKNSSLTFVSSVYQEGGGGSRASVGIAGIGSGTPGLNYVCWLPVSGQGLIYGTNRGSLLICRPVSSNNVNANASSLNLVSTATQTVDLEPTVTQPEMQTTGTQTASSSQQNDSDDNDDE